MKVLRRYEYNRSTGTYEEVLPTSIGEINIDLKFIEISWVYNPIDLRCRIKGKRYKYERN